MKKVLLSFLMLFLFINVNASVKGNVSNIKIENVEVKVSEKVGYNEELSVKFTVNPRDAKNLELNWSIEGLVNGVTAELKEKVTTVSDGELIINISNTLDKDIELTLKAVQSGKVYSNTKLNVQSKDNTIERLKEEVNNLIVNLDETLNKNNYEENKEAIDKITNIMDNNEEIKESIKEDLLTKYEDIKSNVEEYKENNNLVVIGVSIGLVISFSLLLYWIFKKEA